MVLGVHTILRTHGIALSIDKRQTREFPISHQKKYSNLLQKPESKTRGDVSNFDYSHFLILRHERKTWFEVYNEKTSSKAADQVKTLCNEHNDIITSLKAIWIMRHDFFQSTLYLLHAWSFSEGNPYLIMTVEQGTRRNYNKKGTSFHIPFNSTKNRITWEWRFQGGRWLMMPLNLPCSHCL